MSDDLEKRIKCYENTAYKIAKVLNDKGYLIANQKGIKVDKPSYYVIGILEPREPIKKNFLGFKWNKKQRSLYLGTLWLNNKSLGAKIDENLVLEVYGKNNVKKLTDLIEETPELKNMNVKIILASEEERLESYLSDFYDDCLILDDD